MKITKTEKLLSVERIGVNTYLVRPFLNAFIGLDVPGDGEKHVREIVPVWLEWFSQGTGLTEILRKAAGDAPPLVDQSLANWMNLPVTKVDESSTARQASIVGAKWRINANSFFPGESNDGAELFIIPVSSGILAGLLTPTKASCEEVIQLAETFGN
jgi:hypothetical protein